MSGLLKRTLSGAVLVAVMVAGILYSSGSLFALALIITAGSLTEFYRLADSKNTGKKSWADVYSPVGVGLIVVILSYLVIWDKLAPLYFQLVLLLVFLFFISALFRKSGDPFRILGSQLLGLVYIAVPISLLLALGVRPHWDGTLVYNAGLVLFYVILIWINDVGAYLVGITLGRHRLCERLSPKKSWEGFFGGLIFTVAAAVFLGPRMTGFENTAWWGWIIFGVVLTLSAVAGDLVESMFKREAGVKDSGNIIPGHGGFLDRFDAMFISLPFVYLMVQAIY